MRTRWPGIAGLVVLVGCRPVARTAPGTEFDVAGVLEVDTCGPQSVPVDREVRFRAELGVERGAATWRVPAAGLMATGEYAASTRGFRFANEAYLQRRAADRANLRPACVLRRLDVIAGTLSGPLPERGDAGPQGDAGAPDDAGAPVRFDATETIVYGPVEGADCADQVGASDGQFSVLPCEQRFRLAGSPVTPTVQ